MTRIGITHDVRSVADECGGSDHHLSHVAEALSELGEVVHLPVDRELPDRLIRERVDIVCNMARGGSRTYQRFEIVALLEHFRIPFTGGRSDAQFLTDSRVRLKDSLRAHDISVAPYSVVGPLTDLATFARQRFPMAVFRSRNLPRRGERSVARDIGELQHLVNYVLAESRDPVTVEPHLEGASFSCLLIGNGRSRTTLPPVAVDWNREAPERQPVVERIPAGMLEELDVISRRAADAVGCCDIAVVDVGLSENGVPTVVSVDALPLLGCTRSDDVATLAAAAAGLGMRELVQRCLLAAAERSHLRLPGAPVLPRLPRFTPSRGLAAGIPGEGA